LRAVKKAVRPAQPGGSARRSRRAAAGSARRKRVDQNAAADGAGGGRVTQHKAIAGERADGLLWRDTHENGGSRLDAVSVQGDDAGGGVSGAEVQMDLGVGAEDARFLGG
jgi:hypothetical protein